MTFACVDLSNIVLEKLNMAAQDFWVGNSIQSAEKLNDLVSRTKDKGVQDVSYDITSCLDVKSYLNIFY